MSSINPQSSELKLVSESHGDGLTSADAEFKNVLINRELSLIEFFRRVLQEALDHEQPLLERLKFLSILSSNLDEFFMVRVSGLKEALDVPSVGLSPDGMTPQAQLKDIRERVLPLIAEQHRCLNQEILPALKSEGIAIVSFESLADQEKASLKDYFLKKIYPTLTPQGVDQGHPFPYISPLALNLGVMVGPVREHGITQSLAGKPDPRFVRIEVPKMVPRLIPIDDSRSRFVLVEELIAANVGTLFPRMHPGDCYAFRVTRDADVEIRQDEADDLLRTMQLTLRERRFGAPVRLEVSSRMPREMSAYILSELGLSDDDLYVVDDPVDIERLMQLYGLERPDLKDKPFFISVPRRLRRKEPLFDAIRRNDILLHHPYHAYSTVLDFLQQASSDPDVLAIKMCLYRTGKDSPIPPMLIAATESGKQVTVLVELKARFDEENNIEWAQRLERAGVHVVYGVVGLKTHSKLALVVRNEGGELRRYVHIGTGNYNPVTARFYTDLSLFTADEEIGADATDLFNYLTGFSRQKEYRRLLISPVNLREKMIGLIRREAEHARAGRPARIIAKINRLADAEIIRVVCEASQAGVEIQLIVRGVCMLRPGVPGLSENVSVRSVVGRFLEHSRIYYFANGGDEELYTGSADWMSRNFDRRIEVLAPVLDNELKRYLKEDILDIYLSDNVKARMLLSSGDYVHTTNSNAEEKLNSQSYFFGR